MNRSRLNLVLLVVAAGLGVGVWYSQEREEKGPPLTTLTADALTKIAIEHPGREAVRLEKRDGGWNLTAPSIARVDEFEINSLLGLVDREVKKSLDRDSIKLAELGLDPPKYTITLNDTSIGFGDVEPLDYRRYVKVGDVVSLIEDPPSAALDADYADLVAKSVLAMDAVIEKISVPGLTLARGADGKWLLTPADATATTDRMQKLVDGWKSARAMWNEMPQAVSPKGEPVVITLKGGAEQRLVLMERDPQLKFYSPDAKTVYVLSKALTDELLKLPEIPEPVVAPATTKDPGETPAS